MRICFDTNVVLDILTKNDHFFNSLVSYDVANLLGCQTCIPASSLTDIVYIAHRRGLTKAQSIEVLPLLFEQFDIMDTTGSDCRLAYANNMEDYEDALVAESCKRNGIDLIITRNVRDFEESPVPAITPADFVRIYKPANYDYAEIEL